jgi:hypothetical protein
MTYRVSFQTHEAAEGLGRSYSWFVFDAETGVTLKGGFATKEAALAWAMREHGWTQ